MATKIKVSKVFTKNRKATTRIVVNEGSSRSTKTISILQLLIQKAMEERVVITISRSRLTWIKATILVDFFNVLRDHFGFHNPEDSGNWKKGQSKFIFDNGSVIDFIGLDEPQKFHGRSQDYAYINEAMEAKQKDFTQLALRTRKQIFIDYNPSAEQHWIYDRVIPRDDCTFIKSTYKDNPFLVPEIVEEIERLKPTPENIAQGTADEVAWKIYGLGERAAHRGLIFGDTQICKELPPRSEWKRHFYGLDFGFTNDPTAFTLVVLAHGNLYFKQLIYERRLTNRINAANPSQKSIELRFNQLEIPKNATIWADAAEPKSIADLQGAGWIHLKAAEKGPDSIKAGIDSIKRFKTFITEDSVDAIKEKNNYKWKEEKDGTPTNVPIDTFNHFWDSVRYAVYMELRRPTVSFLPISGHSHQR